MNKLPTLNNQTLQSAYQYCENLAKSHYENFPVASWFLPRDIRRPVSAIYAFARSADDIADEGSLSSDMRLAQLDNYEKALDRIAQGGALQGQHDSQYIYDGQELLFIALHDSVQKYDLPLSLFYDLLRAFKQDVIKQDYANAGELLEYCQYSANPVGRLLLHLTKNQSAENCRDSDKICTALQLINFAQDLYEDLHLRKRCYIPKDDLQAWQISIQDLLNGSESDAITHVIHQQLKRAETLLREGERLGRRLNGKFGFEVRLIVQAGHHMLQALYRRNSVYHRPVLKSWDWPLLFIYAL